MRMTVACLAMLLPAVAFASAEPKDKYICNCHITPGIYGGKVTSAVEHKPVVHHRHITHKVAAQVPVHHHAAHVVHHEQHVVADYPGESGVITSNKLALPAGKSIYAPGELVYISGRVLDKNCVPVSDAIVDIWQADPDGKYVHASLAERLSPGPVFAGTGRATTDNLGRFNFVTVFPGSVGGRAPFIHVHVRHRDFPSLDTEMFFADDRRNASDPIFTSLSSVDRSKVVAKVWERDINDPDKGLAASWDISLNGKNLWRHF